MVLKPYGAEWREHRKLARIALNPPAVKSYQSLQERFAGQLALEIINRPDHFYDAVRL